MARPQFQDLSPADAAEMNTPAQRQVAPAVEPLDASVASPTPVAAPEETAAQPTEITRLPADTPPRNTDSRQSKELEALEKGFDDADNALALENAKTPEQREAEKQAKEAEEKAKAEAEKPADTPPTPVDETEQAIAETEKDLKNPNLKPRDKKRYGELLKQLKAERSGRAEEKAAREALDAKYKELEAKGTAPTAADNTEVEKLRKELEAATDENLKYKRLRSLDSDPEVSKRFDEPVKQAEAGIVKTLEGYQIGKPTLDIIEKEGGFAAFSKSKRVFNVTEIVNGEKQQVQKTASELTRAWLDAMDPADAEGVRALMQSQAKTRFDRENYVTEESAKAKSYFAEKDKQSQQSTVQQQEANKKMAEEYNQFVGKYSTEAEWLKPKTVPTNATPEQKAAIEDHNKFVDETIKYIQNPVTDVKSYVTTIKDAAEARHLRREQAKAVARIKELEAQIARVQSATSTTPKAGSILPGASKQASAPKEKKFDPMKDDPTDRLVADFEKLGQ